MLWRLANSVHDKTLPYTCVPTTESKLPFRKSLSNCHWHSHHLRAILSIQCARKSICAFWQFPYILPHHSCGISRQFVSHPYEWYGQLAESWNCARGNLSSRVGTERKRQISEIETVTRRLEPASRAWWVSWGKQKIFFYCSEGHHDCLWARLRTVRWSNACFGESLVITHLQRCIRRHLYLGRCCRHLCIWL